MCRQIIILACALNLMATMAFAQRTSVGSGPYPAIVEGDPGVAGHTIYRPKDLSPFNRENPLPVIAWGNGGCANSSQMHANFLAELASHGFLVIAIGPFETSGAGSSQGQTKSAQLLEALDWATAENKREGSKYLNKLNPSKFAAMGMSCGGLQALEVSPDPRVTTSVIMNSGVVNSSGEAPRRGAPQGAMPTNGAATGPARGVMPGGAARGAGTRGGGGMGMPAVGKDLLKQLHAPILYVIGGERDIAYANAMDDFAKIETVPVGIANLDVGHGGTYSQPNGGEFGRIASAWIKWQLKGDEEAAKMFTGEACGLCKDSKWKFEKKKLP